MSRKTRSVQDAAPLNREAAESNGLFIAASPEMDGGIHLEKNIAVYIQYSDLALDHVKDRTYRLRQRLWSLV